MGEAKRRKLIDPDYGKPEFDMLPDYGDYLVKSGLEEMNLCIDNPAIMVAGNEGYIQFSSENYCGTILTTPSIARSYQNRPFVGKVKPSPQERYRTSVTKEWVTPLRIVQIL